MGNPRRDAFEYGVLMTLGSSMAAAYAFMLAYSNSTGPDGQRRKLPKVDLDAEVDLSNAWGDMKDTIKDLRWGQMPRPSSSSHGNDKSSSANAEKQQPSSRSGETTK